MSDATQEAVSYSSLCDMVEIEPVTNPIQISNFSENQQLAESEFNERLTAAMQVFMEFAVGDENMVEKIDRALVDSYISKIDELIGAQIDEILHNKDFQELEAVWRNLKYLVDNTNFRSNIKLAILDVDKETLREDFEEASETTQSGLYKHVYEKEYDTPGGEPVSAIVSNYEFDAGAPDINMLSDLSKVASAAHCPFFGSVGAKFFGKKSMNDVAAIQDLRDYMDKAEYIRWNSFRETDDARYIGLVLPEYLVRLPYGENNPVKSFNYEEQVESRGYDKFLFGSAAFPFAANLTRSFKNHGWTVSIRGPEAGGKVESLCLHQYDVGKGLETKIPTEIVIPETRELDFAELGFIPFSYYKGSDYACFFSANSTNKPQLYDTAEATANSRINARLPYVFLASRLGHYLKVIQRENIGMAKDKGVLENELNRWLSNLVTKMPNPSSDLVAKHPLRDAQVIVEDIPENPGYYRVKLYAMPHFQVEGIDIKLSLVSQMPGAK